MITKSTTVQLKVNLNSDITTTQNPLEIGIMNVILSFQNIYGNWNPGKTFTLKWSIAAYASPYWCGTRRCDLCITEKYIIVRADEQRLLNKLTEFISKCRYQNKFFLKNVK